MEKEAFEDYVNMLKEQVEELQIANVKLAYAVKLMSYCYYTEEEKMHLAVDLDSCQNAEQVEKFYNVHVGELRQTNKEGTMMTPEFSRGLISLYKEKHGFNPLEEFSKLYEPISTFIRVNDQLSREEPGLKRDKMEKHLDELKEKIVVNNSTINHLLSNV
jgi:hypothetical protein